MNYYTDKTTEPEKCADENCLVCRPRPFRIAEVEPTRAPRTQKAKGVAYLNGVDAFRVPPFALAQTPEQVAIAFDNLQPRNLFARPCPVRPRHGFVDSQPVATVEDALRVFDQARAADPDAELLLMPHLRAIQSAVLTPNAISVGESNDGVTGKGTGVVTLPLAHVDYSWLDRTAVGITDTPYIESVQSPNDWSDSPDTWAVQLRDGPAVTRLNADAYIPRDVTVAEVWTADGDLLEWESRIKSAPEGVAVHMPGGSMLSHYAVHAVMREIPVVFTESAPVIGTTLKANVNDAAFYTEVAYGLTFGIQAKMPYDSADSGRPLTVGLLATHQSIAMITTRDGALCVGAGAAFLLRAATAACLGEARHHANFRNNVLAENIRSAAGRGSVYRAALANYPRYRKLLAHLWEVFTWDGWDSGYGGRRWAMCAAATIDLDTRALAFMRHPVARTYKRMILALHTLLNQIHNGGSWVGKFGLTESALDDAAAGNPESILQAAYTARRFILAARRVTSIQPWARNALPKPDVSRGQNHRTYVHLQSDGSYLVGYTISTEVDPDNVDESLRYARVRSVGHRVDTDDEIRILEWLSTLPAYHKPNGETYYWLQESAAKAFMTTLSRNAQRFLTGLLNI